jgi:hypothetical protein
MTRSRVLVSQADLPRPQMAGVFACYLHLCRAHKDVMESVVGKICL